MQDTYFHVSKYRNAIVWNPPKGCCSYLDKWWTRAECAIPEADGKKRLSFSPADSDNSLSRCWSLPSYCTLSTCWEEEWQWEIHGSDHKAKTGHCMMSSLSYTDKFIDTFNISSEFRATDFFCWASVSSFVRWMGWTRWWLNWIIFSIFYRIIFYIFYKSEIY